MELSLVALLRRLFNRQDKKRILILLLASVIVSAIETVSISAIMVFIGIATNFEAVLRNKYLGSLYYKLGFAKPSDFVVLMGLGLIVFYFFRAILCTVHIYYMNKFAYMREYFFSRRLFKIYLEFKYKDLVQKNSAKISEAISGYTTNATQVISALLTIFSELFTVLCIYCMLFYVNWKMTIVLSFLLSIKVFFVVKTFSNRIARAGKRRQKFSLRAGKTYGESFGNYKFLKLVANPKPIFDRYASARFGLAQANTVNAVWQALPRYVLETIGFFILLSIIVYVVFMYNNASFVLPTVSMYALAFYRFMPSLNKMVMGYNQIMFNKHALQPLYKFLLHDYEQLGNDHIIFDKTIELKNIAFAYTEKDSVLSNANLVIPKGQRVGFVGESGAGKSTIVDIVMGLFHPQKGQIFIDKQLLTMQNLKSWRRKIGYIPQTIYLFDGTIAENIVCGREYDEEKVIMALKKAHIYDFLMSKEGLETKTGEGGIKLSGGQKQRVAIARALYADPDVLVLDEATSALDNETESKIMDEIYDVSQDKTLIVIAHRLTTIERCDRVYKIEDGFTIDVSVSHCRNRQAQNIAI